MKLIYVASPYQGNVEQNVEDAKAYCRYVMAKGNVPLASHLLYPQMLDDTNPDERQLGIQLGFELLKHCDELWAFGETLSLGMSLEVAEAESLGIPILKIPSDQIFEEKPEQAYTLFLVRENGRDSYLQTAYAREQSCCKACTAPDIRCKIWICAAKWRI